MFSWDDLRESSERNAACLFLKGWLFGHAKWPRETSDTIVAVCCYGWRCVHLVQPDFLGWFVWKFQKTSFHFNEAYDVDVDD